MWGYFWAFCAGFAAFGFLAVVVSVVRDLDYWIEWDEKQDRARRERNESCDTP